MKNLEYIRKHFLYVSAEVGKRPIDDESAQISFLRDFYIDYKSNLEYQILKSEMTYKLYDTVYTQMYQKLLGIDKKTPFGLPESFYTKLDNFYYVLMEDYFPLLKQKISEFNSMKYKELNKYIYTELGMKSFNRVDLSKLPKLTQIAYDILQIKEQEFFKEQERIRQQKYQREREQYQKQRENDPFSAFNNYGFFGGGFNSAFFNWLFNAANIKNTIPTDSFDMLGLKTDCSVDEVKKAYRTLSLKHHPDTGGSHEKFIELTEAKEKCLAYLS